METIETWDGDEWEAQVNGMLQDQYGPHNIQKIPAQHSGDSGIDYYCLDELVVWQCYAVEEPVSNAERARKQKGKITTDVGKFCDPSKGASDIFKG